MSFTMNKLSVIPVGGAGGNSLAFYHDTTDNLASLAKTTVNKTYFGTAYTNHGVKLRTGDVILATYVSSTNSATGIMLVVPATWDSNGASVIPALTT